MVVSAFDIFDMVPLASRPALSSSPAMAAVSSNEYPSACICGAADSMMPVRSFIPIPVDWLIANSVSSCPDMSSAAVPHTDIAPANFSVSNASPVMSPTCAICVPTVSKVSPVSPSLVFRSCTKSPASANDVGTVVAMPFATPCSSSRAFPEAPVPTMIVSVISSNSAPTSNRAFPTAPAAATGSAAANRPLSAPSLEPRPPKKAAPAPADAVFPAPAAAAPI